MRNVAMETPEQRHGGNLYPTSLRVSFGPHDLVLDAPEGVWNPTPHAIHLGEMLLKLVFEKEHVLELGTGCGIHAILLAHLGAERLTLTEIDVDINLNAQHNLQKAGVTIPIEFEVADWTAVTGASHHGAAPWDTVVANPPFARSGKRYRRYFIDKLILDAHKLVRPGGRLVFVQSSMADIPRSIGLMEDSGMEVRIVGETDGPFREYYFEDAGYMREMASVPGGYDLRDGVYYERLIVFESRLPG